MRKIIDYKEVKVEEVFNKLKEGWQPYESGYCSQTGRGYQPMVKYVEESKKVLKDFKILFSNELDDEESLKPQILEHVKLGYELHGPMIIYSDLGGLKFMQAMVLYE